MADFDYAAQRAADLEQQFGQAGLEEIAELETQFADPDDAVREYRRILRSRGEGEPV